MSTTIERFRAAVEAPIEADSLPKAKVIELYPYAENQQRWQQRLAELYVQIYSHISGGEEEDASQRSHLFSTFVALK